MTISDPTSIPGLLKRLREIAEEAEEIRERLHALGELAVLELSANPSRSPQAGNNLPTSPTAPSRNLPSQ